VENKQSLFKNNLSRHKALRGFALAELLLIIAIMAGLAAFTVIIINPAEFFAQMRDAQRSAAIGNLRETVGVLVAENPSLPTGFGATNLAYISLPDTHSDCRNITNLPVRTDGRAHHCVTAENLRNINGTGWVPVNLTAIKRGSPISVLPVDPTNNSNFFYEYLPSANHRYTFSARIESAREIARNPLGIFAVRFIAPFNFNLSASPSSGMIIQGDSIFTTVTSSLISGVAQEVSFSVSGLPADTTATFSPASCNPLCHSTLNIVTGGATPIGAHSITITAKSRDLIHTAIYSLTVN